MELKCAQLCAGSLEPMFNSKKDVFIDVVDVDHCMNKVFIVFSHGQKNRRLVHIGLQCDLDQNDKHFAVADHYTITELSNIDISNYPLHYDFVLTGFGVSGTFAEYVAEDLFKRWPNRAFSVVTFASPRGGGYRYYRNMRSHVDIIHHDWSHSYPPRICGFYVKRRTVWDGSQFRVMGQTIVPSTSILSQQYYQQHVYFHQMKKLLEHLCKVKPCDPA